MFVQVEQLAAFHSGWLDALLQRGRGSQREAKPRRSKPNERQLVLVQRRQEYKVVLTVSLGLSGSDRFSWWFGTLHQRGVQRGLVQSRSVPLPEQSQEDHLQHDPSVHKEFKLNNSLSENAQECLVFHRTIFV